MRKHQLLFVFLLFFMVCSCAAKVKPEPDGMMIAGIKCYEKGSYDEAIECFKTIVKKDDSKTEAYLWLGRSFLKKEGPEHVRPAIVQFKSAQGQDNSKQNISLIMESILYRAAEYSAQEEEYMESVCYLAYSENFDSENIEALVNIARIYYTIGNLPAALSYAKRAYVLDPENSEIVDIITQINPI